MSIIIHHKSPSSYNQIPTFPDQYVSLKEKKTDQYIKTNMDYFASIAHAQYERNRKTFKKNYDLLKGIIRKEDFYDDPVVKGFIENLETDELQLPNYIKHYPILNPPINTLLGELSKRPDTVRVRALDQDSRNEHTQFRTDLLMQKILSKTQYKINRKISENEVSEQEEQISDESLEEELMSFTTAAERWGANVLEATKVEFNLKEKNEDAFRDLLTCSSEFYHVFESQENSLGLNVSTLNPVGVWKLSSPNRKYAKQWYAGGFIEVMEVSEIIDTFPKVTKEEIDHLRKSFANHTEGRSGYGTSLSGISSIEYDTYNQAALEERIFHESRLGEENNTGHLEYGGNYGNKFTVIVAYWRSKIKIGKVLYQDEITGEITSTLVDETYKKGTLQGEISLEWRYANQWYQGVKIGSDIYHVEEFKLLNYIPIVGVTHEIKNTSARSLVDLMKSYQMIYNVCLNQLWNLLEKEKGKVILIPLRHIPVAKDGDSQDALDLWEMEAKERGAIFLDDSPENAKALSSFNQYSALDLTRTQEIQSRYNLAVQIKTECWELVGLSRERLGNIAATTTATGINTSLSQSYAQTEPYFSQHEYVLNDLYQAILDAALYTQSQNPVSSLSFINSIGENAFVEVNGADLALRDLKVYVTSRLKDQVAFSSIQQLSQAALQNGASLYDVAELYTTDSIRKMKDSFKRLKKKQEQFQQQQQQMQQQQLQQQQEQFSATQQLQYEQEQARIINENYQRDLDRVNKKEIAIINTFNRQKDNLIDSNNNEIPDMVDLSNFSKERESALQQFDFQMKKIENERTKLANQRAAQLDSLKLEKEKLALKREEIKAKINIAKTNKNQYDK